MSDKGSNTSSGQRKEKQVGKLSAGLFGDIVKTSAPHSPKSSNRVQGTTDRSEDSDHVLHSPKSFKLPRLATKEDNATINIDDKSDKKNSSGFIENVSPESVFRKEGGSSQPSTGSDYSNSGSGSETDLPAVKIRHASKRIDTSDVKRRSIGEQMAEIAQELGLKEDDEEDEGILSPTASSKSDITSELSELNMQSKVEQISKAFSQGLSGSKPLCEFNYANVVDISSCETDHGRNDLLENSSPHEMKQQLEHRQPRPSDSGISFHRTLRENNVEQIPHPDRKIIIKEMVLETSNSNNRREGYEMHPKSDTDLSESKIATRVFTNQSSGNLANLLPDRSSASKDLNNGERHLDQHERDMLRKDLELALKARSQPNSDSDEEDEYDASFLNDKTYAIIAEHALRRGSEKYGFASDDLIEVLSTIMEESDCHGSETVSVCSESVSGVEDQRNHALPEVGVDDALNSLSSDVSSKKSEDFWTRYLDSIGEMNKNGDKKKSQFENKIPISSDMSSHTVEGQLDNSAIEKAHRNLKLNACTLVKEYEELSSRVDEILKKYRHFNDPLTPRKIGIASDPNDVRDEKASTSQMRSDTHSNKEGENSSLKCASSLGNRNTTIERNEKTKPRKKTIEEVIKAAEELLSEDDDLDVAKRIRKRKRSRRYDMSKLKEFDVSSDDDSVSSVIENRAKQISLSEKIEADDRSVLEKEKKQCSDDIHKVSVLQFEKELRRMEEASLVDTEPIKEENVSNCTSSISKGATSPVDQLNTIATRLDCMKRNGENVAGALEKEHLVLNFVQDDDDKYQVADAFCEKQENVKDIHHESEKKEEEMPTSECLATFEQDMIRKHFGETPVLSNEKKESLSEITAKDKKLMQNITESLFETSYSKTEKDIDLTASKDITNKTRVGVRLDSENSTVESSHRRSSSIRLSSGNISSPIERVTGDNISETSGKSPSEASQTLEEEVFSSGRMYKRRLSRRNITEAILSPEYRNDLTFDKESEPDFTSDRTFRRYSSLGLQGERDDDTPSGLRNYRRSYSSNLGESPRENYSRRYSGSYCLNEDSGRYRVAELHTSCYNRRLSDSNVNKDTNNEEKPSKSNNELCDFAGDYSARERRSRSLSRTYDFEDDEDKTYEKGSNSSGRRNFVADNDTVGTSEVRSSYNRRSYDFDADDSYSSVSTYSGRYRSRYNFDAEEDDYNVDREMQRRRHRGSSCVPLGTSYEPENDEYQYRRSYSSRYSYGDSSLYNYDRSSARLDTYGSTFGAANSSRTSLNLSGLSSYGSGYENRHHDNSRRSIRAQSETRFSSRDSRMSSDSYERLRKPQIKFDTSAFRIQHFGNKSGSDYVNNPGLQTNNQSESKSDNLRESCMTFQDIEDSIMKFDEFLRKRKLMERKSQRRKCRASSKPPPDSKPKDRSDKGRTSKFSQVLIEILNEDASRNIGGSTMETNENVIDQLPIQENDNKSTSDAMHSKDIWCEQSSNTDTSKILESDRKLKDNSNIAAFEIKGKTQTSKESVRVPSKPSEPQEIKLILEEDGSASRKTEYSQRSTNEANMDKRDSLSVQIKSNETLESTNIDIKRKHDKDANSKQNSTYPQKMSKSLGHGSSGDNTQSKTERNKIMSNHKDENGYQVEHGNTKLEKESATSGLESKISKLFKTRVADDKGNSLRSETKDKSLMKKENINKLSKVFNKIGSVKDVKETTPSPTLHKKGSQPVCKQVTQILNQKDNERGARKDNQSHSNSSNMKEKERDPEGRIGDAVNVVQKVANGAEKGNNSSRQNFLVHQQKTKDSNSMVSCSSNKKGVKDAHINMNTQADKANVKNLNSERTINDSTGKVKQGKDMKSPQGKAKPSTNNQRKSVELKKNKGGSKDPSKLPIKSDANEVKDKECNEGMAEIPTESLKNSNMMEKKETPVQNPGNSIEPKTETNMSTQKEMKRKEKVAESGHKQEISTNAMAKTSEKQAEAKKEKTNNSYASTANTQESRPKMNPIKTRCTVNDSEGAKYETNETEVKSVTKLISTNTMTEKAEKANTVGGSISIVEAVAPESDSRTNAIVKVNAYTQTNTVVKEKPLVCKDEQGSTEPSSGSRETIPDLRQDNQEEEPQVKQLAEKTKANQCANVGTNERPGHESKQVIENEKYEKGEMLKEVVAVNLKKDIKDGSRSGNAISSTGKSDIVDKTESQITNIELTSKTNGSYLETKEINVKKIDSDKQERSKQSVNIAFEGRKSTEQSLPDSHNDVKQSENGTSKKTGAFKRKISNIDNSKSAGKLSQKVSIEKSEDSDAGSRSPLSQRMKLLQDKFSKNAEDIEGDPIKTKKEPKVIKKRVKGDSQNSIEDKETKANGKTKSPHVNREESKAIPTFDMQRKEGTAGIADEIATLPTVNSGTTDKTNKKVSKIEKLTMKISDPIQENATLQITNGKYSDVVETALSNKLGQTLLKKESSMKSPKLPESDAKLSLKDSVDKVEKTCGSDNTNGSAKTVKSKSDKMEFKEHALHSKCNAIIKDANETTQNVTEGLSQVANKQLKGDSKQTKSKEIPLKASESKANTTPTCNTATSEYTEQAPNSDNSTSKPKDKSFDRKDTKTCNASLKNGKLLEKDTEIAGTSTSLGQKEQQQKVESTHTQQEQTTKINVTNKTTSKGKDSDNATILKKKTASDSRKTEDTSERQTKTNDAGLSSNASIDKSNVNISASGNALGTDSKDASAISLEEKKTKSKKVGNIEELKGKLSKLFSDKRGDCGPIQSNLKSPTLEKKEQPSMNAKDKVANEKVDNSNEKNFKDNKKVASGETVKKLSMNTAKIEKDEKATDSSEQIHVLKGVDISNKSQGTKKADTSNKKANKTKNPSSMSNNLEGNTSDSISSVSKTKELASHASEITIGRSEENVDEKSMYQTNESTIVRKDIRKSDIDNRAISLHDVKQMPPVSQESSNVVSDVDKSGNDSLYGSESVSEISVITIKNEKSSHVQRLTPTKNSTGEEVHSVRQQQEQRRMSFEKSEAQREDLNENEKYFRADLRELEEVTETQHVHASLVKEKVVESTEDRESGYFSKLQVEDLEKSHSVRDSVSDWLDRYGNFTSQPIDFSLTNSSPELFPYHLAEDSKDISSLPFTQMFT